MCTSTCDTQSIASQHLAEDACPDLQVPSRRASDSGSRVTFTWFLGGFAGGPSIRGACDASEWRSKIENKCGVDCPCGFGFVTPHGQDDAVAMVQLHVNRIHKQDFPNGLSREDALKEAK